MIVARTVVSGIRVHFVHRFSEWVFAWMMAAFASSLLAPGDTFGSSPSYTYMASWMTEEHWGEALLSVAAFRFFALAVNGSFNWFAPFSPSVRCVTAWVSSVAWVLLSVSMFYGNPIGTGWRVYGILAIADVVLAILIAGEAGRTYTRHIDASTRKR